MACGVGHTAVASHKKQESTVSLEQSQQRMVNSGQRAGGTTTNNEKRNDHEQPIRELQYVAGVLVVVDVGAMPACFGPPVLESASLPCSAVASSCYRSI